MDGNEGAPQAPPAEGAVVTEDIAAAKAAEARAANIGLMNAMLESRRTQGDYFIEVGSGEDIADHALILKAPAEVVGTEGEASHAFLAVTADGVKRLLNPQRNTPPIGFRENLTHYFSKDEPGGRTWELKRYNDPNYPREIILNPGPGRAGGAFALAPLDANTGKDLFTDALEKSIVTTESPLRQTFNAAQAQVDTATSLGSVVSNLPART